MTTTTATRRLVNCYTAVLHNGDLLCTGGADGIPARAMLIAEAATVLPGDVVHGVAIKDVRTGEAWLVPLGTDMEAAA